MRKTAVVLVALGLSGCAVFEDVLSIDSDGQQTKRASDADASALSELSIMTGRYGVMLGQARDILRLPEPKTPSADEVSPVAMDLESERKLLAKTQVQVAKEFLADTAQACQKKKISRKVRSIACSGREKVPAEFQQPSATSIEALTQRTEAVGKFVMAWWDEVCALAPRSRPGEPHACSIE